jgi:hypothetical protein
MNSYSSLDTVLASINGLGSTLRQNKKDKADEEQRKLLNARQAKQDEMTGTLDQQKIASGRMELAEKVREEELNKKYEAKIAELTGQGAAPSISSEQPASSGDEYDQALTDPVLRDTLGVDQKKPMLSPALSTPTKADDVEGFRKANEALAPFGDRGKTYLGNKKDLADKQITTESAMALRNATNAQRDEELSRQRDRDKSDAELKRLAIEATKGNRDVNLGLKEQQQQDKLEQQYRDILAKTMPRNPAFRLQDQKVASAIHTRQAFEGSRDENGNLHLNQITTPESALALATLVSGKTTTNLEEFKAMSPQSLYSEVKKAVGFITGKPTDILTKEWADNIQHMIDRQGVISEGIRDKYLEQYRKFKPSRLEPDRAATIESTEIGPSYSQMFGMAPEEKDRIVNPGKYKGQPATSGSSGINLSGDKAKRLEELRRKQAEGTLK